MQLPLDLTLKNSQVIHFRLLQPGDAQRVLDYFNPISAEKTFITFQGKQLTLKEEEEYLDGFLKKIIELTISESINHISAMKIITLGVFASNTVAHKMYQDFGFVEYGNLPDGIHHNDNYVNHLYMYKVV